ncbi:hypothetical protein J2X34_000907 [Rhodococcus sp. BE178]
MARHGTVVGLGWPVTDHDHRVDEPVGAPIRGAARYPPRSPRPKRLLHFTFEAATGLEIQCLVDRFVAHSHALVVRKVLHQAVRDLFGRQPLRQPVGHRLTQHLAGDQFGLFRPGTSGRRGPVGLIGQIRSRDTAGADLPRDRRNVLADPGRDRPQRPTGQQPVRDRQPVRQGQIPAADRGGAGPARRGHRHRVSGTTAVVHDRPVAVDTFVADLAGAVTPVPSGAFVDPDLPGGTPDRPTRPDEFEEPASGLRLAHRRLRLVDQAFGHQDPPGDRMRHPARLRRLVDRPGHGEHRRDLPPIDRTAGATRPTCGASGRPQNRVTPLPRNPQRRRGILHRHTGINQTHQPITEPSTVLRKRHGRRNPSHRECCDDRVNPPKQGPVR